MSYFLFPLSINRGEIIPVSTFDRLKSSRNNIVTMLVKKFSSLLLALCVTLANAGSPLNNLKVSLRGKKYEISDVSTVAELQAAIEKESGLDPKNQGRILFGGKRLLSSDVLSDAGVSDGAQLNLVPGNGKTKSSGGSAAAAPSADGGSVNDYMQDMLKSAGVDPGKMDELMSQLPSGEGGMEESLNAMSDMMKSPMFQEYMSDPEKLEQSRQMILQNPMLKGMMGNMPGMEELLNNPDAWREAMQAAANMYQNMDPNDLMKAMGGMGGMPGGDMFGDATAALDELSEGE